MRSRARWSSRTLVALLIGGLVITGLPSSALAGPVPDNVDFFMIVPGIGNSFQDFSSTPLPVGFFGPGSLSFTATVVFTGVTLSPAESSANVTVRRLDTAKFSHPFPSDATVGLRIEDMSLGNLSTIRVGFLDGHTETWNLTVGRSSAPQPTGSMTITHSTNEGGNWTASLPVLPLYTFTRGTEVRVVDTADAGSLLPQWNLSAQGIPWEHQSPKTIFASNRFCPACFAGAAVQFNYDSANVQLRFEPAFPAA